MSGRHKAAVFVAGIAAVALAAWQLPVTDWLIAGIELIAANKTLAWPLYVAAYVLATVLLVPGALLTLAAGFVFGLPIGVVLVSISSIVGASCAFVIGRHLARDWVRARVERLPRFQALDQAAGRDGFLIVLLVRLSPIFPFNATNYAFGLTSVSLRDYFFASWIGMLPGTILYVYIGTLALDLTELAAGGFAEFPAQRYFLIAGFAATVLLTILVTRRATHALNRQLEQSSEPNDRGARNDA